MCGRFLQFWFDEAVLDGLGAGPAPKNFAPSYNVAPAQKAWIIRQCNGSRRLDLFRWGLVPPWSNNPRGGGILINARLETAAEKPSFRAAFKARRCLVPANGFYEWTGARGDKQPYFCTAAPKATTAFAGIWEMWSPGGAGETDVSGQENVLRPEDGPTGRGDPAAPCYSFAILTREASPSFSVIHPRMPVILSPQAYGPWLDPQNQRPGALKDILESQCLAEIAFYPVSKAVNSSSFNGPETMAPLTFPPEEAPIQQTLF